MMVASEATEAVALDLTSVAMMMTAVMTDLDGDSGGGDSSDDDRAESIVLTAVGAESIILSAPSFKP
jgi:hypothetical protein